MDELHGLLPKLKDLGMENKYADGNLLLRPELFYYNQGLTLKHQKAEADKFEKARILFTLSSKMASEEYMSTLFSEEVIEKLRPQVVSMHGIDLPPELMHWRDSVGIIVKDSVRNSVSLAEQMAILRILSESENNVNQDERQPEQSSPKEGADSPRKAPSVTQPALTSLERLKQFARNRGSLSRKDLDHLNSFTIDTLNISSASSSRRPSRVASASNTPTAPRASEIRKMDFSILTSSDIYRKYPLDAPLNFRESDAFQQQDLAENDKYLTSDSGVLDNHPENNTDDANTCNFSDKKPTEINVEDNDINSWCDNGDNQSKEHSLESSGTDKASTNDDSISSRTCFYNKVREDCSWHSDMDTFAEPRSDMSFSDSDYEELLYEILAEYRLEASNESNSDSRHLAKTQVYYSNDLPVEVDGAGYRSYLATFRKRLSALGVLDRCAVESKSLRQGTLSVGPDALVHEKATFSSNYEVVRSRFMEHIQIDVSIPVALANTLPISTSYSGSTTYKSFILDKYVDGIIVANAVDDSATLYIQPAHDHYITRTKKTVDKLYSQDAFIKRNYTIEYRDLQPNRLSPRRSTLSNEFSRHTKASFCSEHAETENHHLEDFPRISSISKSCYSGITAKPNSRVGERYSQTVDNRLESDGEAADCNAPVNLELQHEGCVHCVDSNYQSAWQSGYTTQQQELHGSTTKVTPKLTLSMLNSTSSDRCKNDLVTVQPSLHSLNNTTISLGGAVQSLARTIKDQLPEKILSHSIVSSNIRAIDSGKAIHRHSILMKSNLPTEFKTMSGDFTNETLNAKICELNSSSLFKKPRAQISNICESVPSGVIHMGASSSSFNNSIGSTQQASLNFFEKSALLRYEKFAASKAERKILNSWQLTSTYGPNLIPFGGSNIKHSAVYVDIRDVIKAREQIKTNFRNASDSSANCSIKRKALAKKTISSISQSTTYARKNNTISVCAPKVSTHDHADWKLEKYSKQSFNTK